MSERPKGSQVVATAFGRQGAVVNVAQISARALLALLACALLLSQLGCARPQGGIASAHPLATDAGQAVLAGGGNAFDAAVAVAAALAVVEPYSSGLGGGGFVLLHRARDGREVMIDARETAPGLASPAHYVHEDGTPVRGASVRGGTAAGIPGTPAVLVHLAEHYGRLPLARSLAPAIRLAREGFAVDARYAQIAAMREALLRAGTGTAVFLDRGRAPAVGFELRQPALAETLERLARYGRAGFYSGAVARELVETVNRAGGHWRLADLEGYRLVEREPVRFAYRGATITSAALPSAGGIALAQALGILEHFQISRVGEPQTDHLVIEALRRVFQDRARYLGDPDFVAVPVGRLVSPDYLAARAQSIDPARATPSKALGESVPAHAESASTSHFSIIDAEGNRVAATLTINLLFGSGIVAAGVLLNNEMDDFTLLPGVPNAFGLIGGTANAIAPGKRPLSSMTPTFVEDARGVLVVGSPGGSRIVSQVLLAVLEHVHMPEVDLERMVSMARYHHQYLPDHVEIEPEGHSAGWQAALAARGHALRPGTRAWGNMQAVFQRRWDGSARAASDPRGAGVAWY
jgi:gamma-glutamyltranspeptidase / glutathione hydrolase